MKNRCKYLLLIVLIASVITGCGGKSAKTLHKDGLECLEKKNYQEAVLYFEKAIEKNDEKAEYYIDYGFALSKDGQKEKALKAFNKAILNRDNKIVRENNKRAYRGKGIAYFEAADYNRAISEFKSAIKLKELDNLNVDILSYIGEAQLKLGEYQEALETFDSIIKQKKSDANMYAKRADILVKLKEYEKALEDYNKAIHISDKNYNFYFAKYFMLLEQGDKEAADNILVQLESMKPKTKEDRFNVGKLEFFKKNYVEAKKAMEIALKDEIIEAYYYLGEIERSKAQYEKAITYYEKYIEKSENKITASVYNQMGSCMLQMGEYKKALDTIEKGLSYNDDSSMKNLQYNEIIALEKNGQFEEAKEKADTYMLKYPDDADMQKEYDFMNTRVKSKKKS